MAKRKQKSQPTWTDVKAKLADFDRAALLGLIQSLYAAHKDNQMFLHTRFGLAEDVLEPYKKAIDRWLWPDVLRNQNTSVARAKRAISDYKKAVGDPEGLAELMVLSCLSWKWKERSFVKIAERTHEKRAQALHRKRESSHPEATLLRPGPSLRSV
jgi:hypothetical protein